MVVFGVFFVFIMGSHFGSSSAVSALSQGAWVFGLAGWIAALAVPFQTGRWIARRARDKEMAACAAFLIVQTIVMPIIGEILFGSRWLGVFTNGSEDVPVPDITVASITFNNLMSVIALLTGTDGCAAA
jgi:hypothetical protein